MKQHILQGFNSCDTLPSLVESKKVFLITGNKSYETSCKKIIEPLLKKHQFVRYSIKSVNPKSEDIEQGVKEFSASECELIVCIGGGSVLDTAKAIAILYDNKKKVSELLLRVKYNPRTTPLIAIPTTAGSGAESTHFAVVYHENKKYSLTHESMLPDCVILDPTFTLDMPPLLTAITGLDALSQAIESLWSVQSTPESIELSKKALKMILNSLHAAVHNSTKQERENMLLASNLAGQAINIAKTTAPHALSYMFTTLHNIPHGHAVAITLPSFVEFNANVTSQNCMEKRGEVHLHSMMNFIMQELGASSPADAKNKLTTFIQSLGLKTSLTELDIHNTENIVLNVNKQRLANNPRIVITSDIQHILNNLK